MQIRQLHSRWTAGGRDELGISDTGSMRFRKKKERLGTIPARICRAHIRKHKSGGIAAALEDSISLDEKIILCCAHC